MLPAYFSFLTGYAGATRACIVIATLVLMIKLLAYLLWRKSVTEAEGRILDVRKVTSKGGFKYAGGYVIAVQYIVDSVTRTGFLFKQGHYRGTYNSPNKMNVYFSTTGLTRAIRDTDNMPVKFCALVAIESFIAYTALSNTALFLFNRFAWADAAVLVTFMAIIAHAAKNIIDSSVAWGGVYRRLYMKKSVGYNDCNIKGGIQDRFEKVCALESKVLRRVI